MGTVNNDIYKLYINMFNAHTHTHTHKHAHTHAHTHTHTRTIHTLLH